MCTRHRYNVYWVKVLVLRKYLPLYDWVIYMDADVVIHNYSYKCVHQPVVMKVYGCTPGLRAQYRRVSVSSAPVETSRASPPHRLR